MLISKDKEKRKTKNALSSTYTVKKISCKTLIWKEKMKGKVKEKFKMITSMSPILFNNNNCCHWH